MTWLILWVPKWSRDQVMTDREEKRKLLDIKKLSMGISKAFTDHWKRECTRWLSWISVPPTNVKTVCLYVLAHATSNNNFITIYIWQAHKINFIVCHVVIIFIIIHMVNKTQFTIHKSQRYFMSTNKTLYAGQTSVPSTMHKCYK